MYFFIKSLAFCLMFVNLAFWHLCALSLCPFCSCQ